MPVTSISFVSAPSGCCAGYNRADGEEHHRLKVFERYPGVKRVLWGGALWERGYFVMSSGTGTTDEMIRRYIRDQRRRPQTISRTCSADW